MAIDVSIADTTRSYHVPLLMAPFSLTTYRGS
jgi:5-hydroxyisourate hydrolase-like protein (transthyretin family)